MYYNFLSHNFLSLDFQIYRSIALILEALNSVFFLFFFFFFFGLICMEAQMGAEMTIRKSRGLFVLIINAV